MVAASAQAAISAMRCQKCARETPARIRQHQADADQRHEARDDHRAESEPERIVLEVGADDAEVPQVEREVVHDHQADGDAAQRVDPRHAQPALAGPATHGGRRRGQHGGRGSPRRAALMLAPPAHRGGICQFTRQPLPSGVPTVASARARVASSARRGVSSSATPRCGPGAR